MASAKLRAATRARVAARLDEEFAGRASSSMNQRDGSGSRQVAAGRKNSAAACQSKIIAAKDASPDQWVSLPL